MREPKDAETKRRRNQKAREPKGVGTKRRGNQKVREPKGAETKRVREPKGRGNQKEREPTVSKHLKAPSIRSRAESTGGCVKLKKVTKIRRSSVCYTFITESVYLVLNSLLYWEPRERLKQKCDLLYGILFVCLFFNMKRTACDICDEVFFLSKDYLEISVKQIFITVFNISLYNFNISDYRFSVRHVYGMSR